MLPWSRADPVSIHVVSQDEESRYRSSGFPSASPLGKAVAGVKEIRFTGLPISVAGVSSWWLCHQQARPRWHVNSFRGV